jgi:hypothetical protein
MEELEDRTVFDTFLSISLLESDKIKYIKIHESYNYIIFKYLKYESYFIELYDGCSKEFMSNTLVNYKKFENCLNDILKKQIYNSAKLMSSTLFTKAVIRLNIQNNHLERSIVLEKWLKRYILENFKPYIISVFGEKFDKCEFDVL